MRGIWLWSCLAGCGEKDAPTPEETACAAGCGDTGAPVVDTAPPDTADPIDTQDTQETAAPVETGDTAPPDTGDTGEPVEIPCTYATFTSASGVAEDLTAPFTSGDPVTLLEAGTLAFCPGEWFVHLTIKADVSVVGLGKTREETVLSAGEAGRIIAMDGAADGPWALAVENVTLERGKAPGFGADGGGGAIYFQNGAVSLTDVTFTANRAEDGGGIQAKGSYGGGLACELTATDVDFVGNYAQDDGGAVELQYCNATFQDVLFQDNDGEEAGALYLLGGTADLADVTFSANTARWYGGAIAGYDYDLTVETSSFLENYAPSQGGAVQLFGDAAFTDVTFEGNYSDSQGGSLYFYPMAGAAARGESCDFADNSPDDLASTTPGSGLILGSEASFTCEIAGCSKD